MKLQQRDSRKGRTSSTKAPKAAGSKPRLGLQALEPRVLLDAAAARTAQEVAAPAEPPAPDASDAPDRHAQLIAALDSVGQDEGAAHAAEPARTEVYFVDASIEDVDALVQGLPADAEIHLIEPDANGIEFIAQTLQGRSDIGAVHILSHGEPGALQLGSASLTAEHMQGIYRDELVAIGQSLAVEGDILIYGCDFGGGDAGAAAVQILAELTGADVAASTDSTGAASLGGDWDLERQSGTVETAAVSARTWEQLMAAPVLDATKVLTYAGTEDSGAPTAGSVVGTLVSDYTVGMSDSDPDAAKGIAITGTVATNGTWWYTQDGGATWSQVGTVSGTSALLLADNPDTRLYFQPNANFNGNAGNTALTIRGWDQSAGAAGTKVNPTTISGAVSTASDTVAVTIAPVNDAPVLATAARNMTTIVEDGGGSVPAPAPAGAVGTSVATFIGTTSDADTGAARGIAIVGSDSSNGTWWYSTNNGTTWTELGDASDANALLLSSVADSRVFFQPNADYNGTASFNIRAWDQTSGTNGGRADTSSNGGTTAFSSAIGAVNITVTASADIKPDTINGANSAQEEVPKVFDPIGGTGGATADTFEGSNPQIVAIAGQDIAPGGSVTVTNGTVTLGADGRTLTFLGAPNASGSSVFTYTVSSGGILETASITMTIAAVDDAPVIDLDTASAGTGHDTSFDQEVAIGGLVSITDVEGNNLRSMTLSLASPTAADRLYLASQVQGILAVYNSTTGVLTLTGNASLAHYQSALSQVRFVTTSGELAVREISVQAFSSVGSAASNVAVTTVRLIDSDGDGVFNSADIDDDNDGIIDEVEDSAKRPISLVDGSMDGASNIAWTEDRNTSNLNSNVTGSGWTSAGNSPDTWKGPFSLEGSGYWGGAMNGVPGAPEGEVFIGIYSGFLEERIQRTIPESAGIQVGEQVRISFQQIFGGVNGITQVGMQAYFVITVDGVSYNADVLTYEGNVAKTWSTAEIVFTATSTTPKITVSIKRPNGGNGAYLGFGDFNLYRESDFPASLDLDSDGFLNRVDLDSDNDGIGDNIEAQTTASYRPPSGQSEHMVDVDRDGLDDRYDADVGDITSEGSVGLIPADTDGDATADFIDTDSDEDGRLDIAERGDDQPILLTSTTDTDRDGLLDIFEHGTENDGFYVHDDAVTTAGTGLTATVTRFNLADTDADTADDGHDAEPLTKDFDWRDGDPKPRRAPIIDLNSLASGADTNRGYEAGFSNGDPAVSIAALDADVTDLAEEDLDQLTIAVGGVLDGNDEIVSIGGVDFLLGTDASQVVTVNSVSLLVSYTVAGGFTITNSSGTTMPQSALDTLVRGMTYRHTLATPAQGVRTLTFAVRDNTGLTSAQAVSTVNVPRNAPPTPTDPGSTGQVFDPETGNYLAVTPEDVPFNGQVAATDADGDTLAYELLINPTHGTATVDRDTGAYTYTPDPDFNGDDSFVVSVSDGNGGVATSTVAMQVLPVRDIMDDATTTNEDQSVTIALAGPDGNDDFESEDHEISAIDGVSIEMGGSAQLDNGVVRLTDQGTVEFTPSPNFNGNVSFTYTVRSGGVEETAVVTIAVRGVNDPPVPGDPANPNLPGQTFDPTTGNYAASTTEDMDFVGQVAATDADGDALTYSVSTEPTHGTVEIDANTGAYTYRPTADFNGEDSFVVTISDGNGGVVRSTVFMTVTPVADIADDTVSTNEDVKVPVPFSTNDNFENPGHALTAINGTPIAVGTPVPVDNGSVMLSADGSLEFTPAPNFNGVTSFTYTIRSGGVDELASVTVNVLPVNDVPVPGDPNSPGDPSQPGVPGQTFDPVTGNYAATTTEDTPFGGKVVATDADGDKLTYTLASGPLNGTVQINTDTGAYTYTPTGDFNGEDSFVVTVSDGRGGSATSTVTMTVTSVADIVDDAVATQEDTTVTIAVGSNDSFENPTHAVTQIDGRPIATGGSVSVANGSVVLNANGTLAFTPAPNFVGATSFTYTVSSGGVAETATVSVNVTAVNDPPVPMDPNDPADPGSPGNPAGPGDPGNPDVPGQTFDPVTRNYAASTTEDMPFSGQVTATDAEGDTLTYTLQSGPAHGTVTVDASTGAYTYIPTADFNGADRFVVAISDGNGATVLSVVDMAVTPVVDIADDTVEAPRGGNVIIEVGDNDSFENTRHPITQINGVDVSEGDTVPVGKGMVTVNADGTLTYAPNPGERDADSFTYTVTSGGVTETANVAIAIVPPNAIPVPADPNDPNNPGNPGDPGNPNVPGQTFNPVTGNYAASTQEDVPFAGRVAATDADGDTLTYTLAGGPSHGTVSIDALTGAYVYTPTGDFNGEDSFVVTVSDGYGGSVQATVTMTVTAVADIVDDAVATQEDTTVTIAVGSNDSFENPTHAVTQIDGRPIATGGSVSVANGSVVLNANGTLAFTPAPNFVGATSFTYTVSSGGVAETATVSVNVTAVNDPPVPMDPNDPADPGSPGNPAGPGDPGNPDVPGQTFDPVTRNYAASTTEDMPFSGQVTATDAEGDTLTYTLQSGPAHGTVTVDASTGAYTYIPTADFNGADRFVVAISDGNGGTVLSVVDMAVTPVADIADDAAATDEDVPVTILVAGNDSFENSGHSVTAINGRSIAAGGAVAVDNGTVTLNTDGTLAFTPSLNFNGTTSFTYTVTSGGVDETATVTVNLAAVNDPPVPVDPGTPGEPGEPGIPGDPGGGPPRVVFDPSTGDYHLTIPQDTSFDGRVVGVDPDGDSLTYTLVTEPTNGTVRLNPDGSYTYTPNASFVGSDLFVVTISDGQGGVVNSTVYIDVTPQAARDDFPFVRPYGDPYVDQHGRRDGADRPLWNADAIGVGSAVVSRAVNGADSLHGTTELNGVSGIVLQAVNGVDSLKGTESLRADGAVLQAVNGIESLQGSATDNRQASSLERSASPLDRADVPRFVATLRASNGMALELSSDRQHTWVSVSGDTPVREVRATLADGRPLPSWAHMDSRGFLVMDRPVDVEQLRLRITVVPERGATRSQVIEVDFNAGQLRAVGGGKDAASSGRSTGSPRAEAPVANFATQLAAASEGAYGADADLLAMLDETN